MGRFDCTYFFLYVQKVIILGSMFTSGFIKTLEKIYKKNVLLIKHRKKREIHLVERDLNVLTVDLFDVQESV
jgi:hypothetical protein